MLDGAADRELIEHGIPVALVCTQCGADLGACASGCVCGTRLELRHGIAHVQSRSLPIPPDEPTALTPVLELMANTPWREALRTAGGHDVILRQLTARIGCDLIHGLPWARIHRALDIGAGMGALAFAMARHGAEVIALESSCEKARFMRRRAEQDRLSVHPVVVNGPELPFSDGTFDLVTLNGNIGEVACWGEGEPGKQVTDLLRRVHRLLRPGGYVYIGSERRPGLSAVVRRMVRTGRRTTFACTPRQYRRHLAKAGFASIEVHGVVGHHQHQRASYDLADRSMRAIVRGCTERPISLAGRLHHALANSRLSASTLERHVAIVACRETQAGPLLWGCVCGAHAAGQINTYSKAMALCRQDGTVRSVAEVAKTPIVDRRLATAFDTLRRAERAFGAENALADLRWVRPLETLRHEGRNCYRYEFVPGPTLTTLALSRRGRKELASRFERVLRAYPELCRRLAATSDRDARLPHACMLANIAATWWDPALVPKVAEALAIADAKGWATAPIQGDLSGDNVIVTGDGGMCLIDWETVEPCGYPVLDLIRLHYDLAMVMLDARVPWADAMIGELRTRLWRVLCDLGHTEDDLPVLETLYLGHQAEALGEKARSVGVSGMRLDRLQSLVDDARTSIRFAI